MHIILLELCQGRVSQLRHEKHLFGNEKNGQNKNYYIIVINITLTSILYLWFIDFFFNV